MKNPSIEGFFYGLESAALGALQYAHGLIKHGARPVQLVGVSASLSKLELERFDESPKAQRYAT